MRTKTQASAATEPPTEVAQAGLWEEEPEIEAELEPEPRAKPLRPVGGPKILVGTASWTDPSLIKCKRFYPRGCNSAEARLRHYASVFPLVEVNSSYYALPSPSNSQAWVERTPDDFIFNVKAFRLFTHHQTPLEALPPPVRLALGNVSKSGISEPEMPRELVDEMWKLFIDAVEPLRSAGKLGTLHFQFGPRFECRPKSLVVLDQIRERLAAYTLSVEFRHMSWFDEDNRGKTLEFEMERGLVNVVVDEPQGFTNSIGSHWVATNANIAYVRLHGRNAETWNIKGATAASERFNYDYPDLELMDLAEHVRSLAEKVGTTHVIFNNNMEDQGQRNASTLMRLLGIQR